MKNMKQYLSTDINNRSILLKRISGVIMHYMYYQKELVRNLIVNLFMVVPHNKLTRKKTMNPIIALSQPLRAYSTSPPEARVRGHLPEVGCQSFRRLSASPIRRMSTKQTNIGGPTLA